MSKSTPTNLRELSERLKKTKRIDNQVLEKIIQKRLKVATDSILKDTKVRLKIISNATVKKLRTMMNTMNLKNEEYRLANLRLIIAVSILYPVVIGQVTYQYVINNQLSGNQKIIASQLNSPQYPIQVMENKEGTFLILPIQKPMIYQYGNQSAIKLSK